ncbi:MAG: DUF6460 domain-containing protein [Rhizobiaceae bacterium]|nr:DUF6460 domain-containing protein [Rhizobiaceae bacterium]
MLARILGDSPLRVLVKLLAVSLVVGMVMHAFGWSPLDVFYSIENFFINLWNMGFRAFDRLFTYLLLGAAVVIPAFIVIRLLNYRR